eukprot:scaffold14752_cov193-Alexandrium_tamarense.AAC.2
MEKGVVETDGTGVGRCHDTLVCGCEMFFAVLGCFSSSNHSRLTIFLFLHFHVVHYARYINSHHDSVATETGEAKSETLP